ncbi:hypothetical protein ACKVWC_007962 [Pyricularia oryzae]
MASSSASENADSPIFNHRMMGSPGRHQASISSDDEYPHLPCRNPIKFRINIVQIGRSAICVFAFIDMFLVAFSTQISTTVPLIMFLIATLVFNAYHLVGHLLPRGPRLEAPFFSFQLFCIKVTCGGDDNGDDESRSLLGGFEWHNDDPKSRRGIWKELVDITLAVVLGILMFVHMNDPARYWYRYSGDTAETSVASYVFAWLVVAFELIVVFLEAFNISKGATIFLCPDEGVAGHVQHQIRLPPSPSVVASRSGEHVSIVA